MESEERKRGKGSKGRRGGIPQDLYLETDLSSFIAAEGNIHFYMYYQHFMCECMYKYKFIISKHQLLQQSVHELGFYHGLGGQCHPKVHFQSSIDCQNVKEGIFTLLPILEFHFYSST